MARSGSDLVGIGATVPVQVPCPAPIVPARPHLPIADLKPTDQAPTVIRAYVASVAAFQGYSAQLEADLGASRKVLAIVSGAP